jgi:hypothetical protein
LAENIDSPVFKKRPLTLVEIACLLLDSSVEHSPVFRKKNSSVWTAIQNNNGLIKSLIEEDEEEILNVNGPSNPISPEPSKTCVKQVSGGDPVLWKMH